MRKSQDTELLATGMQLASALARVAFLEKRLDNSVSREEHDAVIAERDFFKTALELKERECEQRVESVTAEMCRPLVNALFDYMRDIREAGNEYGTLAQNAANYLLDDEDGFRAFLTCGLMEIGNNAIERCFRPLALGRRNWLQCGSHEAAEHTAFMYSLVQSCRLNKIDFGDYIEYVLREIMNENKDYRSLLPNHVKLPGKQTLPKVA